MSLYPKPPTNKLKTLSYGITLPAPDINNAVHLGTFKTTNDTVLARIRTFSKSIPLIAGETPHIQEYVIAQRLQTIMIISNYCPVEPMITTTDSPLAILVFNQEVIDELEVYLFNASTEGVSCGIVIETLTEDLTFEYDGTEALLSLDPNPLSFMPKSDMGKWQLNMNWMKIASAKFTSEYYVLQNGGDDFYGDGSINNPFAAIAAVIAKAVAESFTGTLRIHIDSDVSESVLIATDDCDIEIICNTTLNNEPQITLEFPDANISPVVSIKGCNVNILGPATNSHPPFPMVSIFDGTLSPFTNYDNMTLTIYWFLTAMSPTIRADLLEYAELASGIGYIDGIFTTDMGLSIAGSSPESQANKGAANGYAGLDAGGYLLPSGFNPFHFYNVFEECCIFNSTTVNLTPNLTNPYGNPIATMETPSIIKITSDKDNQLDYPGIVGQPTGLNTTLRIDVFTTLYYQFYGKIDSLTNLNDFLFGWAAEQMEIDYIANYIGFRKGTTPGTVKCVTKHTGTTLTDNIVCDVAAYHKYEIKAKVNKVIFCIDDVIVATHETATNIPSEHNLWYLAQLDNSTEITNRSIYVDRCYWMVGIPDF